jgi:methylphosphotriester-DNA--protein-cysteine methyltransferase
MSTDIDGQVAALKERIAQAQKRRSQAEAQVAVAQDRAAQAERALQAEFGIGPSEAGRMLARLKADLAAEAQRVEDLLKRAEASE